MLDIQAVWYAMSRAHTIFIINYRFQSSFSMQRKKVTEASEEQKISSAEQHEPFVAY